MQVRILIYPRPGTTATPTVSDDITGVERYSMTVNRTADWHREITTDLTRRAASA